MGDNAERQDHQARPKIVSVAGLSKTYGNVVALDDVTFSIRSGEILGLIGPNGAGKTTLFECLAGVQPTDKGTVAFPDGREAARRGDVLFYLPEGIVPWPDQSVEYALQFALDFLNGRRDRDDEVMRRLDIGRLKRTRVRSAFLGPAQARLARCGTAYASTRAADR